MKKIALIALCIFITGCGLQRFQNALNRRSAELEKIGDEMELIIPQIIDEIACKSDKKVHFLSELWSSVDPQIKKIEKLYLDSASEAYPPSDWSASNVLRNRLKVRNLADSQMKHYKSTVEPYLLEQRYLARKKQGCQN